MARRRYFRPGENIVRGPRVNEQIRISPVRLIDAENNMVGVVETRDALDRARAEGLDLVEISPESTPPVCRIMDYGKWKYEQSKKDRANKARSKSAELKEVRLGRSIKIDPHDIGIRLNQARKFLRDGHKVQIVQQFRGREMVHRHLGDNRMAKIAEDLSDIAKVEVPARMNGRRLSMIVAPDRVKIEAMKRREAAAAAAAVREREKEGTPESDRESGSERRSGDDDPPTPAANAAAETTSAP